MSKVPSPPIVNHEFPSGEDWDEEIRKEEGKDWDAELKKEDRPPGYLLFTGIQGRYVFGQADIHDFPKTEKKKKKGKRGSQRPEDPILEEAVKLSEGRGLRTEEFYF
jgi:hypothetical protein